MKRALKPRPDRKGNPAFRPTEEQRRFVAAMAGMGMRHEDICRVLGSGRKYHRGPMARTTLDRHFRHELDGGIALFRFEITTKLREAVRAGQPWAILAALRNVFRWDRQDGMPLLTHEPQNIQIQFCMPDKKPEEPKPPVDVTPPASTGPVQPLDQVPRIEGPRPRFRSAETGVVFEMPRDQPPSAFDAGNPRGWMK
jgi:hypothetical protein